MSQLWFFYKQFHQTIILDDKEEITVGNEKYHTITIQAFSIEQHLTLKKSADGIRVKVYQDGKLIGTLTNDNQITVQCENEDLHIQYVSRSYQKKMYYIDQQTVIYFPDEKKKYFSMIQSKGKWLLQPESETVYINGKQVIERTTFNIGDTVFCSDLFLVLESHDTLIVKSRDDFKLNVPLMKKPTTVM